MNQVESAWKLVIKMDIGVLEIRYQQLRNYTAQMEDHCNTLIGNVQQTCSNVLQMINKDNAKLALLLTHLRALCKTPNNKRGLIDAIGTVSKMLFGTMDADDEKIINEQLNLLANNQQTLQHAMKNQLKILTGTIGHMDSLEKTLNFNENLLFNVTERMKAQLAKFSRQEDVEERLLVLTTITTDLIDDTENILDFLVYTKEGVIMTRLIPVEQIIAELREATFPKAKPLTKLTKKGGKFEWTTLQQHAFETLKNKLTSALVLKYPDFSEEFLVTIDGDYVRSRIIAG